MPRIVVGLIILAASFCSVGVATASAAADLSLASSRNGDFVVGESTAFVLTVNNLGPDATTGLISVVDVLPTGMTYYEVLADGWACIGGSTVTCNTVESLDSGDSLPPVVLYAIPTGAAVPSGVNRATVSNAGDPVAANNASDLTAPVAFATDMSVSLGHIGAALRSGETETVNVRVHNEGYYRIEGTTVLTVPVPASMQVVSVTGGTTWNCSAAQTVTCTTTSDGGSTGNYTNIRLVVRATDAAYPSVAITGTVSTPGDQNPANNSSTDTVSVRVAHDAALELVPPPVLTVGSTAPLTFRARNAGTAALAGVTISFTLPPQLRYAGFETAGWICTPGAAGASCTDTRAIAVSSTLVIRVRGAAPVVSAPVSVALASAGDQNPANDAAAVPVAVKPYVPGSYRLVTSSGQRRATTIRVGDKLTVRLPQPRRGAKWRVRTQSTAVGPAYVTRASGRIQFRFTARRAGRATLRFTRRAGGRTRRSTVVVTVVNPGA